MHGVHTIMLTFLWTTVLIQGQDHRPKQIGAWFPDVGLIFIIELTRHLVILSIPMLLLLSKNPYLEPIARKKIV